MDRINNLQMSLFGNFINIKPKTDIVIRLLTSLEAEQFIPGSADIANVDLNTGKMTVDSRMQLVSPDRTWAIVFLNNRIDFNYVFVEGTTIYQSVEPIVSMGKNLIQKVFSVFAGTTGNRLAVNCKLLLENMSPDDMRQFCDRFTKPLEAGKNGDYAEWSVRYNTRSLMKVDTEIEETCNRIVEMAQVEQQDVSVQPPVITRSVIIGVDVNTSATDLNDRFKYNNLLLFGDQATDFISDITKEIEGRV